MNHRAFFDLWSRVYERTPLVSDHLRRMQARAVEALHLPPGAKVFDLGCGPGRGLVLLRRRGHRAFGGDLSRAMLRRVRRRALQGVQLTSDALPFRTGAFDGVVCTNSFHHHPSPLATLREVRRVLRPGGRAVFVDPDGGALSARLAIYGGERLVFGMRDVHLHTASEWRSMLRAAGFSSVEVKRAGRFEPRARASVLVRGVA